MINGNTNSFVNVYLEGLMISCINSSKKRLETAIMREVDHDFSIRIVKYLKDEKTEDNVYSDISLENSVFQIEGVENPEIDGISTFQDGSFNRADENLNHQNDFRWITDLEGEEFHNSKLEPTGESLSTYNTALTPLYIKNAELYSGGNTTYDYNKLTIDENGNITNREFFGKVGYVLVANINADKVSLNFEGTEIPNKDLQKEADVHYNIFFTNIKEGGDDMSELPVYYRVVKSLDDKKFEIEKIAPEVQMYHGKVNCSKVFLGETETINNLT